MKTSPYARLKSTATVTAAIGILLALAVGCGSPIPRPGLEARRAATDLAASIDPRVASQGAAGPDFNLFATVYQVVQSDYVHPVEGRSLVLAATQGIKKEFPKPVKVSGKDLDIAATEAMLSSLDPYSVYMSPEDFRSFNEDTRGAFGGLGIEVTKRSGRLTVISPIEGTPADKAGLKPGDVITHANGVAIDPLELRDAVRMLRGRVGTAVELRIEREGKEPFTVTLTRDIIKSHPVRWHLEDTVGYIRIVKFQEDTAAQVREAVEDIEAQLGDRLDGFVLDLRSNPGGYLQEAVGVSDVFMSDGVIVSTKGRRDSDVQTASGGDLAHGLPLVVLINGGSASASEIVSGALQDSGRGILIGERSYGKGSVQRIFNLNHGDGLKLTTALYFTPSGRSVEGGIVPDMVVEQPEGETKDMQLREALSLVVELSGGPEVIWDAGAAAE
ncbi:S41 family peptidase [Aestuariispira ectoiniformans]|uniref:S41 family peptidase n=1 Tax=Aestuariispira ectoiniformans TaxID=2775080 RepID=UPI00223C0431|nr:S41 family peptidase [Aestuariispira ectoiniformans]